MCIFDFLIANQDRHSENWGLIFDSKNIATFAPLYDNGSSLFNGIDNEKVDRYLNNDTEFKAYTNRAKSIFTINDKKKPKHLKLLQYLIDNDRDLFLESFSRFEGFGFDIIYNSIDSVDYKFMTEKRKQLVIKLILHREQVIRDLLS